MVVHILTTVNLLCLTLYYALICILCLCIHKPIHIHEALIQLIEKLS